MSKIAPPATRSSAPKRLPLSALLALATSGFLTVMLETLPAGVLPALSRDLGVEEGTAGQAVTLYALGALLGAIPIISATMGWPRRRLLVIALSGYVLTSLIVAVSPVFAVTLAARFIAGVFAGTLWGILAGYVGRIVDPTQRGRALTIGLSGTPIALAFGTPAGTLLASAIGWRLTFVTMAVITAAVVLWVLAAVPPLPGRNATSAPLRSRLCVSPVFCRSSPSLSSSSQVTPCCTPTSRRSSPSRGWVAPSARCSSCSASRPSSDSGRPDS